MTLLVPPSYEGLVVDGVGGTAVVPWPDPGLGRSAAFRLVGRLLGARRVDATISSFSGDNVLQAVAARRGVPARIAWHHTPSTQLLLDGAGGPRWHYQRRRKAWLYRRCTDVLVATDYVADDIERRFGVDPAKISREVYAMPAPGPVAATPVPGRLLLVGRFHASKGHDWFLRALPAVIERVPDLTLHLTGDGGPEDRGRVRA